MKRESNCCWSSRPVTVRPGKTASAFGFSSAEILFWPVMIPYAIEDSEWGRARKVSVEYSLNGGGQWFPATEGPAGDPTTDVPGINFGDCTCVCADPERLWPFCHVFSWDTRADLGTGPPTLASERYDNVVARVSVE